MSIVAVVAVVFSVLFIWFSRNTGEEAAWKVWLPFIFCGAAFLARDPGLPGAARPHGAAAIGPAVRSSGEEVR